MMNEEVDLTEDEFDAWAVAGKPAMVITGKAEVEKFLAENSPRDSRYLAGYKAGTKDTRIEADENMRGLVAMITRMETQIAADEARLAEASRVIAQATQVIARYCLSANRWVGLGADINDLWGQLTPEEREEWIVKAAALVQSEPLS